tara:strand:+ start:3694 stop:3894 length:201 start_codon:yes stop_codon:yes gene_type:complete
MANIKLLFYGTESSQSEDTKLQCYVNDQDEIFIDIDDGSSYPQWLCLDKSTAIKLAKTLRTEINKI